MSMAVANYRLIGPECLNGHKKWVLSYCEKRKNCYVVVLCFWDEKPVLLNRLRIVCDTIVKAKYLLGERS